MYKHVIELRLQQAEAGKRYLEFGNYISKSHIYDMDDGLDFGPLCEADAAIDRCYEELEGQGHRDLHALHHIFGTGGAGWEADRIQICLQVLAFQLTISACHMPS